MDLGVFIARTLEVWRSIVFEHLLERQEQVKQLMM